MTQDEIIDMAMEAEFVSRGKPSEEESELFVCTDKDIVRFAKLVAAKEREACVDAAMKAAEKAIDVAIELEREACAKLADEYATWGGSNFYEWFKKLATAIRARGEQA
jgi:hypothetical protein